jgi:putative hydrolase of the HAD superfamily
LEKLADSYSLYLLSNTNQRHIEVIDGLVARQYGRKSISNWFIKAYYSFETGYRKPHPRAYQMILEEQGLVAEQTLMVDDLKENIEAAGRLGMKTLWLNPGELTMEKLTSAGI